MKPLNVITLAFILICLDTAQAQIKIHNDNHVSIGSLSKSYGIQVQPNGYAYFQCTKPQPYAWMELTYANNVNSKCYIVQYGSTHTYFVYGNGVQYSTANFINGDIGTNSKDVAVDSALSKIVRLNSVYYQLKDQQKLDSTKITDKYGNTHSVITSLSDNDSIDPKIDSILEAEKDRKYIGLVADEVEKVVPELVRTKPDGSKAIAYYSLTSLLVEAIKAQQTEIENINKQLEYFKNQNNGTDWGNEKSVVTKSDNITNKSGGLLFQNQPNPFSEKTIIRFKVNDLSKKATIYIFNMQGSLIKSFENLNPELSELKINGNDLAPGMYLYSLVIDGNEVDTKRMILTN